MGEYQTGAPCPERERAQLWRWVHQLERLAEVGLHARGLAHDLGNTLTSLMAGLELALLQPDDADLRGAVERGLELSKTASRRLHAYLDFTRRAGNRTTSLALADAVDDALAILAHPIRKSGARVSRMFEADVRVAASRAHVVQAVSNAALALLEACDRPCPTLEIVLTREDRDAVIEIRAYEATNGTHVGDSVPSPLDRTGLELEVARRILTSYGGRFELDAAERWAQISLPARDRSTGRVLPAEDALATWRPR